MDINNILLIGLTAILLSLSTYHDLGKMSQEKFFRMAFFYLCLVSSYTYVKEYGIIKTIPFILLIIPFVLFYFFRNKLNN